MAKNKDLFYELTVDEELQIIGGLISNIDYPTPWFIEMNKGTTSNNGGGSGIWLAMTK